MKCPLVIKFGGASVAKPEHFLSIADIIIERIKQYPKIAVVISAMGDTTDQLLQLARQVHPNPPIREQDMLVSAGERISISLLAMALSLKKVDAISFTGSQSGIITCNSHSDAKIIEVRPQRIMEHLDKGRVVIVAGFQGVSKNKEITTLGRGGSDTSAVALAVAIGAQKVEFFKDVDGIYDSNPKQFPDAKLMKKLSYKEALEVVGKDSEVLHARSIELARKNHVMLQVVSFKQKISNQTLKQMGTLIGQKERRVLSCLYEEQVS